MADYFRLMVNGPNLNCGLVFSQLKRKGKLIKFLGLLKNSEMMLSPNINIIIHNVEKSEILNLYLHIKEPLVRSYSGNDQPIYFPSSLSLRKASASQSFLFLMCEFSSFTKYD